MQYFAQKLHQLQIALPVGAADLIDDLRLEAAYAMQVAITSEEFDTMGSWGGNRVDSAYHALKNIRYTNAMYAVGYAAEALAILEQRRARLDANAERERLTRLVGHQQMLNQGLLFGRDPEDIHDFPEGESREETE